MVEVEYAMEHLLKAGKLKPIGIILVAAIITLAAGFSGLAYPSTYSPVYVLIVVAAVVVLAVWLWHPTWALYTAIFIVFLPAGLIPASLQSTLNRVITVVAFAIWLFDLLLRRKRVSLTGSAIWMLVFITWSLLTFFWVENLTAAKIILQVYIMRFLLFVLLIPNQIRTLSNLKGLLTTMAVSGWLFLVVSLAVLIQQGYTPGLRFKAYDVNENEAGLLTMVMMLGVLWLVSQPWKRYRMFGVSLAYAFITLTMGLVAVSGSRGSAISLFITLLFFLFWRSSRPWGKFGFLILLVAILILPALFTTTLERFTSANGTLLGGREALWLAAWSVIQNHPLRGVGIGGSAYAILPYLGMHPSAGGVEGLSAHNPVLVVWSETGLIGLFSYLGVLISAMAAFVKQYLRYKTQDIQERFLPYFALVASVFAGYLASWIKGGGMQTGYLFFLLIGLLLIPSGLDRREVLGAEAK